MEEEFESLLFHLGRDIGYMGLRVQKDVQKCLKDLRANNDHKRFCNKLADILKTFSEYTVQYSRDLQGRITDYHKEGDYKEIIQKLQKTGGGQEAACKEKGAETSNSLGPPDNNNEEEATDLAKYEHKVLSQHSLHIGTDDEVKSEELTQRVFQSDVPANDLSDITEQYPPTHVADVDGAIIDNDNMCEEDHNDSAIANSLEISHSEDVLSIEDQDEVTCVSDTSNMVVTQDQEETAETKYGSVNDHPVSLDEASVHNNSDQLQKFDVIPLPYIPLSEMREQTVDESTKSEDPQKSQKMNVIALPYRPLFEKEEKSVQESSGPDTAIAAVETTTDNGNGTKDCLNVEKTENNKKSTNNNDDLDVEIVSVASSDEESDGDVEIIETVTQIINTTADFQDGNQNVDVQSAKAVESQATDNYSVDSDEETVKNTPSKVCLGYSNSEETVVNTRQNPADNVDSDVETVRNCSERENDASELPDISESDDWDAETIANSYEAMVRDDAVPDSPPPVNNAGLENLNDRGDDSPLAVPLDTCDDVTLSKGAYSEETDADHSPPAESSTIESDDTIIASPLLDINTRTSESIDSGGVDLTARETKDKKQVSNRDDAEATQGTTDNAKKSIPGDGYTDADEYFDVPTVDADKQDDITGYINDDFIGLTEVTTGNTNGPTDDETPNIDIPENRVIPEGAREAGESDMDTQVSYVFHSEEMTQENLPETSEVVEEAKESNTISQESFVFAIGKVREDVDEVLVPSAPVITFSTPAAEGSVTSPNDENKEISKCDEVKESDRLSLPESEKGSSGSDSDINDGKIIEDPKRKLKDKDRKSLLKVIADFFSKRKMDKKAAQENLKNDNEDDNQTKPKTKNSKRRKNTIVQSEKSTRTKTRRRKKTSSRGKGEKDAKEYVDFLYACNDNASNSSPEPVKEDSSDSCDVDTTKVKNCNAINGRKTSTKMSLKEDFAKNRNKMGESDDEDSDESEELLKSSRKGQAFGGCKSPVQSIGDFLDSLPLKPKEATSIIGKDPEDLDEELEDLTQKVDDLRQLKQISKENIDVVDQPMENVCSGDSLEPSGNNENRERLNKEENDPVVSPFKRKIVRPLPLSDGDEPLTGSAESRDIDMDSQVVSPFRKKSVKRLHSSDDSDSEPPKKTLEAERTQESDGFDGPTQEVVIPLKRACVKRLRSSGDEESVATRKASDSDDDCVMERGGAKRRKVQRLPSSGRDSPVELEASGENKEKESSGAQNEETFQENAGDIEPSQFRLDDKARDDFLNMFDQNSSDASEKDGANEENIEVERTENSENDDNEIEATQFILGDDDRDNFLNLLTDKENDERGANNEEEMVHSPSELTSRENKLLAMLNDLSNESDESETVDARKIPSNISNEKDENAADPGEFKLNARARDEFLDLLNGEPSDDSRDDDNQQDYNSDTKERSDSKRNRDEEKEDVDTIETSQFKLNSAARDELLEMLSSERGDKYDQNTTFGKEEGKEVNKDDTNTAKSGFDTISDEVTDPSQFKLDDKARDEFLDMFGSEHGDDAGNNSDDNDIKSQMENDKMTDQVKEDAPNVEEDNSVDKDQDEVDGSVTENSQGINDVEESDEDVENDEAGKSLDFKLDENEEVELLNLLSDHIKKRDRDSDISDQTSDKENGDCRPKKKRNEVNKVNKDMMLELLQEFQNAVKDKVENGDMEFDNMADVNGYSLEGSDSDSVLLDILREEAVEVPEEGSRRRRGRVTNKAAWKAYHNLLDDQEELSDDTSSAISDIDIDDIELDLSDQERKRTERIVNAKLKERFHIDKELIIDVEQADVSGFDLSLLARRGGKTSSRLDRLCDISNVLQKRKYEKTRRKVKVPRRSPSVRYSTSSSSDNEYVSSSPSNWSDESVRVSQSSSSNGNSPFHSSDDHDEQDKLANALWENIKNSSDETSGWSSDNESSDDDERKLKKGGDRGGAKKGKRNRKSSSDVKEEEDTDDDTSCEKSSSESDDGDESGDKEKKERDIKDADLDSSDEDDFVGVRKGAWKFDPLLKGCLTSDEDSDLDSDSSAKRARALVRIRKKMRQIQGDGDGSTNKSDGKRDGNKTPTQEIDSSDSDVEFVLEKKKTPKKLIVIDDDVEDDSPSKTGKGRRNIRALVEDDELAEATKKAKKEETERIKRLQERERAKESFSQTQSFGSSQLSEDDTDPLLLDVNEQLQIKVHPKITRKLKPHQRCGIQFMWDSCYESVEQLKNGYEGSGCILAHCMGLGKTLQAFALIHTVFNYKQVTKTKHVLVVCPLSTVSNWRNEYKLAYKDIRHVNIQLYTIQDKKVACQRFSIVKKWWKNGGILVMGYECFGLLTNDQKLEKMAKNIFCNKEDMLEALVNPGPDLVICDEGHLLRNKQTQRNLALNKVTTRRRVVLTGTPLQNNLLEYYYMVHFVKPNLLGTEKEFKTNFINPISNGQFEDSTAVDILIMKKRTHVLHKILNKTVQRVEDTELKRYLPELVDQALFVRLSDLQVQFYNTYLDGANARPVEFTAAGNISRKNFLGDIQVLRYICTHPDTVTIAKRSGKSKLKEQDVIDDNMEDAIEDKLFSKSDWFKELIPESGVKQLDLGTKMMIALGIVEEAITANDKVLIFSQTHAEMDSLEYFLKEKLNFKKTVDYNRMDGTISPEVRTHMCDNFNDKKNKRLRVFIMSTKVGGLGLNLTAANRVIIMNVNWNPSYDTQSVFRAFRFGQNKAVYVYRLIAIDTMEEKMYQRQVTKLAVAHRVVDKHQITRHYSAADIQEFYSVRPTMEGERPLPNVPEDRVLAKLIQKFPFLYKWHEHQALLANRPEEDLNEQQKNAAWEEFNKKAVEPPPSVPGMPPPLPQFLSVSGILNQPGPSGLQNRMNAGFPPYPTTNRRQLRSSKRIKKLQDREARLRVMHYRYELPKALPVPVVIKHTPSGPKLILQTLGGMSGRQIPLRLSPAMTVPGLNVNTGGQSVPVDSDAARKIQVINSLVMAQTTPELFRGFDSTTTNRFGSARLSNSHDNTHASRIDEINSIISASFTQNEAVSSQDWADDGMDATLLTVDLPEEVTEDSAKGHFADHNYSLPKINPLNFRSPSIDDFRPIPPPNLPNVPRPLFVDVDAPLDLERPPPFFYGKKYKIYKRPIVAQRVNSVDDFRITLPKYVPRPLFVDVTAPLGPRPILTGLPPGHKNRSATATGQPPTKPEQNQPSTNSTPTQVRLGSAITLTQSNGSRTNPPPAHAQKPSISIIPQLASTRPGSNITTTKPPPYVPKGTGAVQDPLNLTKDRNQIFAKNMQILNQDLIRHLHATRNSLSADGNMLQKVQNQVNNIAVNDLKRSTSATSPQTNKKIITPPPPRRVAAAAPPPALNTILVPPPLSRLTSSSTHDAPPTTSTTTTSNQQSPLQKRMRNFMEHLHKLQQTMKDGEGGEAPNLGNIGKDRVGSNSMRNYQGSNRIKNTNPSLPPRTVVKVGPKPTSPIIGGVSTANLPRLNAARNLSNITKTYQTAKDNNVAGATATTSQSSANRPNVRVIGSHPAPITGTSTSTPTTRVVLPKNISSLGHTNATSPKIVRKLITNSPAINNGGRRNHAGGNTVINPAVGQTNNEAVPRVITRVVGSNSAGAKSKVNPVRLINGSDGMIVTSNQAGVRMIPGGASGNIRVVPMMSGNKKIVTSDKGDIQKNRSTVQNQASPIRVDLLQKKMMTNLNRLSTKKSSPKHVSLSPQGPPRPLPSAPQRSFNRGTNMRTYEGRKNNPPSRANSSPSLSILQPGAPVSKSNKENRTNRKLSFRTNNNVESISSVDLSTEENSGNNSGGTISKDMVNTLKKKGVSINYLGKDVINLD